jgi:hypothetical protein
MQIARGQYLTFVDDDDRISDDYLTTILTAINKNPGVDVLCYIAECRINKGDVITCRYSLNNSGYKHVGSNWSGPPAHTMVWKSSIAKRVPFPCKNYAEDGEWVKVAVGLAKTETQIEKTLYFYDFNSSTSKTRGG